MVFFEGGAEGVGEATWQVRGSEIMADTWILGDTRMGRIRESCHDLRVIRGRAFRDDEDLMAGVKNLRTIYSVVSFRR